MARFVYHLYRFGTIGISQARNALDRLALRAEDECSKGTEEIVSGYYLKVR